MHYERQGSPKIAKIFAKQWQYIHATSSLLQYVTINEEELQTASFALTRNKSGLYGEIIPSVQINAVQRTYGEIHKPLIYFFSANFQGRCFSRSTGDS